LHQEILHPVDRPAAIIEAVSRRLA